MNVPVKVGFSGAAKGKWTESVAPVTNAEPLASTAMAVHISTASPPRKVENTSVDARGSSLVMKQSPPPPNVV